MDPTASPSTASGSSLELREQLADAVAEMPESPAARIRLLRVLSDEDAAAGEIADVVGAVPGFAASVVRVANSGRFGAAGQRFNLHGAVARLGRQELRRLSDAETVRGMFQRDAYEDAKRLWDGSLLGALAARQWALLFGSAVVDPNDAYTAGLFRDLGRMKTEPLLRERGEAEIEGEVASRCALERRAVGFTHAELSAALVEAWSFPAPICHAIAVHHRLEEDPETELSALALVTVLGDRIAEQLLSGQVPRLPARIAVSATQWNSVLAATQDDFAAYGGLAA